MDLILFVIHSTENDLSHGDYLVAAIGIFFLAAMLGGVVLAAYGVFYLFDTAFLPSRTCDGTVAGKYYTEGWTQPGDPDIEWPPQWNVRVRSAAIVGTIDVGEQAYHRFHGDQAITVWYRVGRFSGTRRLHAIG